MNGKLLLSLVISLCFSGVALVLAFRHVPMDDLLHYIGTVNYLWLVPVTGLVLLSFAIRVFRWRWILASTRPLPFSAAFHPLFIGFMLNCILPGRMGEIARPLILSRRESVPFSTALASMVCERLFDLVCLIVLLTVCLSYIAIDPGMSVSFGGYDLSGATLSSIRSGMIKLCIVVIAGVVLISIACIRETISDLIIRIPQSMVFLEQGRRKALEDKIFKPAAGLLEHFAEGLVLLKHPGRILACLGFTALVWISQAFSYHLMTFACPGLSLTFAESSAAMVMVCFFIALPSVPGYWGLWEAGGIFALTLFSVAGDQAAGYTLVNHVIQILPVIVVGLISALIIGVNLKHLYNQNSSEV